MYVPFREITCYFPDHKLDLCVLENSSPGAPNACHRGGVWEKLNGNERDSCVGAVVGLLGGGNSVVQVSTSL